MQVARDHLEQSRLAGPVTAHEARARTGRNGDGRMVEQHARPEPEREIVDMQHDEPCGVTRRERQGLCRSPLRKGLPSACRAQVAPVISRAMRARPRASCCEASTSWRLSRTFSILKPDVTRRNLTGAVNAKIEGAGLRIIAQRRIHMSRADAETFYAVHKERPFFGELVEMMTSAPVVVQVLEGENAILKYREVMGATNPEKADAGTIRKEFALSMGENSVHGSDAPDTAAQEIAQFFKKDQVVG